MPMHNLTNTRRELHHRQSFLAAQGVRTLPFSIPLVMLRWVGCLVFAISQLVMLVPLLSFAT